MINDGAPAIAFSYEMARLDGSLRDLRQVFVVHGGWAYEISDQASPSRYAASLQALGEVIRYGAGSERSAKPRDEKAPTLSL